MSRVPLRLRFACLTALSVVLGGVAVLSLHYVLLQERLGPSIERVPLAAAGDTALLGDLEPYHRAEGGQDARVVPGPTTGGAPPTDAGAVPDQVQPPTPPAAQQFVALQEEIEQAALRTVLAQSAVALAVTAVAALAVAWLVAGRFLTPIRSLTDTARELSEATLHRRIGHVGPRDELLELSESFDRMLDRLQSAFDAQRRFVANASHELRTPVTLSRTAMEVLAAKPQPSVEQVRAAAATVVAAAERSERTIAGLLALARADQGLDRREPVRLDAVAGACLHSRGPELAGRRIAVRSLTEPATVTGDPALLDTLVDNLVANAAEYGVDGGWIRVSTSTVGRSAVLEVENPGPVLPPGAEQWLFEPFRRGSADRQAGKGSGLGLAIVRSVARAHGGEAEAALRQDGGLRVTVTLPAVLRA